VTPSFPLLYDTFSDPNLENFYKSRLDSNEEVSTSAPRLSPLTFYPQNPIHLHHEKIPESTQPAAPLSDIATVAPPERETPTSSSYWGAWGGAQPNRDQFSGLLSVSGRGSQDNLAPEKSSTSEKQADSVDLPVERAGPSRALGMTAHSDSTGVLSAFMPSGRSCHLCEYSS
jgi:hypothetical protein